MAIPNNPQPDGRTPTPTLAGRISPSRGETSATEHGTPDHPSGTYVVPPGVPFYAAAAAAAAAGYAAISYPSATGYAEYSVLPDALRGYAHATGTQATVAAAEAQVPGGRYAPPFLGVRAASHPPMGGNAASLIPPTLRTSLIHDGQGSGSTWATAQGHTGTAGGVPPNGPLAGGPAPEPGVSGLFPWRKVTP